MPIFVPVYFFSPSLSPLGVPLWRTESARRGAPAGEPRCRLRVLRTYTEKHKILLIYLIFHDIMLLIKLMTDHQKYKELK